MQHKSRGAAALAAYNEYVQGDHDYSLRADVLTLEESPVNQAAVLDGQVNVNAGAEGPDRTATLTLSDPEGALAFGTSLAEDAHGVLWVNRLVRVEHTVTVPGYGDFVSVPFIGVPRSVGRSGAELTLELGDKSVLADHGVKERTFAKGTNARNAIVILLRDLTGEHRFSVPTSKRRLSRAYSVGMTEGALTPWTCARMIANNELAWRLNYTADGTALAEPKSVTRSRIEMRAVLELPDQSVGFEEFKNYARVTSQREVRKRNVTLSAVAQLPPSHRLSAYGLRRNGVARLLPLAVDDSALVTQAQVNARATSELRAVDSVNVEDGYSLTPVFHLDDSDTIGLPDGDEDVALSVASIPLGTGGPMTVGYHRWVSAPVSVRAKARPRRSTPARN